MQLTIWRKYWNSALESSLWGYVWSREVLNRVEEWVSEDWGGSSVTRLCISSGGYEYAGPDWQAAQVHNVEQGSAWCDSLTLGTARCQQTLDIHDPDQQFLHHSKIRYRNRLFNVVRRSSWFRRSPVEPPKSTHVLSKCFVPHSVPTSDTPSFAKGSLG